MNSQENKKVPTGFGNFYPKGGKPSSSSSQQASKSTKAPKSEKTTSSKKTKSEKSKGEKKDENPFFGGGGGGGNGGPTRNEMGQSAALAAAMAAWMGYELFSGGEEENGMEISWQEFKNEYLAAGLVERIVVINKTIARVTIRPEGEEEEGSWNDELSSRERRSSGFTLGSNSSRSSRSRERSRHVFFSIGSVESFERKLEFAQRDLGVRSSEFVPVQYVMCVYRRKTFTHSKLTQNTQVRHTHGLEISVDSTLTHTSSCGIVDSHDARYERWWYRWWWRRRSDGTYFQCR